jgi:hypothetical protein
MSAAESFRPLFSEWTELRVLTGGFVAVDGLGAVCSRDSLDGSSNFSKSVLADSDSTLSDDGAREDSPFSKNKRRLAMASLRSSILAFCASPGKLDAFFNEL